MWKTFKRHFLHIAHLHVLISILVLQVWIMHQFFLDQFIFLWNWVFVSLSNDAMSNLHFLVPCQSTTFEVVAGWLLLLLKVTGIVKGCNREGMLQVHLYLLQWPACLNLETTSQTRLNCYPVFHNACDRSCATRLIAHFMLASAACSGHSSIAFGEEIPHTIWNHSVYGMNSSECSFCIQQAFWNPFLPCGHIPLAISFLCPAPASSFALFLSFLIWNKSGIGCYYW